MNGTPDRTPGRYGEKEDAVSSRQAEMMSAVVDEKQKAEMAGAVSENHDKNDDLGSAATATVATTTITSCPVE